MASGPAPRRTPAPAPTPVRRGQSTKSPAQIAGEAARAKAAQEAAAIRADEKADANMRAAGGGGTNALARIRRGAAKNEATLTPLPTPGGLISDQMTGPSYAPNPYARSRQKY